MGEQINLSGYTELTPDKLQTSQGVAELNRMLRLLFEVSTFAGEGVQCFKGYESPESVIAASVGSIYLRLDGGANTTLYVKESGTGDTGWAAI